MLEPPPAFLASVAVLALDALLSYFVILRVPYTEIDWVAYMQEVEGWAVGGETNYVKLRGDTGPLVYPAMFLYIYRGLRAICGGDGSDIRTAQFIFLIVYILNSCVVHGIYHAFYFKSIMPSTDPKEKRVLGWSYVCSIALLSLSKRVHSIFVLRCFNDTISQLFAHAAILLFVHSMNRCGSLIYSLSVGVKMNTLLYAPGILLFYLQSSSLFETLVCLSICALTQVVIGIPFLTTYPISYLRKAFELDRVFTYKWTVNLKFLPEDKFVSKKLSLLLLSLHLSFLLYMIYKHMKTSPNKSSWIKINFKKFMEAPYAKDISPRYSIPLFMVANFVGIAFARTLHYQFYSWYFHSLPLLCFVCVPPGPKRWFPVLQVLRSLVFTGIVMLMIEYAFNVYPATALSSATLQFAHIIILVGLILMKPSKTYVNAKRKRE